jgi:hypothetical protein
MKKLNIKLLGLAGVFWISLMAFWSTFAFQWNPWESNPDCIDSERHEQVTTMFANSDYEGFKTLFEWKKMIEKIDSQEKFEKFTELYEAKKSWDIEKVKEIATELWLWQKKMNWAWNKNGNWKGMKKWNRSWNNWGERMNRNNK